MTAPTSARKHLGFGSCRGRRLLGSRFVVHRACSGHLQQDVQFFPSTTEPKTAKNRMHLDVMATDPQAKVARLLELGATGVCHMEEYGYTRTVMADPEGNEFRVAKAK